jgi:hypothetical protein
VFWICILWIRIQVFLLNPDPDQDLLKQNLKKKIYIWKIFGNNRHIPYVFLTPYKRRLETLQTKKEDIFPFFFLGGGGLISTCLDPNPLTQFENQDPEKWYKKTGFTVRDKT